MDFGHFTGVGQVSGRFLQNLLEPKEHPKKIILLAQIAHFDGNCWHFKVFQIGNFKEEKEHVEKGLPARSSDIDKNVFHCFLPIQNLA